MTKIYVLDTNVLLHSPNALYAFSEHTVVIPEVVIEELDRFKKESSERGANSRTVSRVIDELRLQGNLLTGVKLNDAGGILRLESNHTNVEMPLHWELDKADNRILQICKGLMEEQCYTVLVSRDTNMRVKAAILKIQAEDFRNDKVAVIEQQYTGRETVYTSSEVINRFHRDDTTCLDPGQLSMYDHSANIMVPAKLFPNQFLLIRSVE
ncbi:MAG: PIN domain-containing protein, partial [Bacillota bacterium]